MIVLRQEPIDLWATPSRSATVSSAAPAASEPSPATDPIPTPFVIAIDHREGHPYTFDGLTADAARKYRPLTVRTVTQQLATGDYTLHGWESHVAVERKDLIDLYGTLSGTKATEDGFTRRERFEREHERMAAIIKSGGFACVLIEATLEDALLHPPSMSRLSPKSVDRTRIAWMQRYGVPWLFEGGRRRAEVTCYRILERAWIAANSGA